MKPAEKNEVLHLVDGPIHSFAQHGLEYVIADGNKKQIDTVINRLWKWNENDSLQSIYALWSKLQKHHPRKFREERNKHLADWNRLRDPIFAGEKDSGWNPAIKVYPFDFADPQDIELLRALEKQYPASLHQKSEKKNEEADRLAWLRSIVEERLYRFAIQDFKAFSQHFPHLPLPMNVLHLNFSKLQLRSYDSSLRALYEKINKGEKLTRNENKIKQVFLNQPNLEFYTWMLNSPARDEAIALLKARTDDFALRLMTEAAPDPDGNRRILWEPIRKDVDWMRRLMKASITSDVPVEVWTHLSSEDLAKAPEWDQLKRKIVRAMPDSEKLRQAFPKLPNKIKCEDTLRYLGKKQYWVLPGH